MKKNIRHKTISYILGISFVLVGLFCIPSQSYAATSQTANNTFLGAVSSFVSTTTSKILSFLQHNAFVGDKTSQKTPNLTKFATTSYVLGTNDVVDFSGRLQDLTQKYNTLVSFNQNQTSSNATITGGGSSPNLLRNSSFEQASNNQPTQWNYQLSSTTSNTFVSAEGIHSGSYGLKFLGSSGGNYGISQPIVKTIPGKTYTFSLYFKAINVPYATIKYGFWNEHDNTEGRMKTLPITGTKDWTRISMTSTTPGVITDSVNEFPLIEVLGLTSGAIYIDDAKLEEGSTVTVYNSADAYPGNNSIGNGSILTSQNGDFYPAISQSNSLGLTTNPWSALYLKNAVVDANGNFVFAGGGEIKGSLQVDQGITIANNSALTVTGTANFGGSTVFNGQTYAWPSSGQTSGYVLSTDGNGNLSWALPSGNLTGNVTLGTNASNTITPNGLFNASIIPSSTSVNLGSSSYNFGTVYAQNLVLGSGAIQDGFWQLNSGVLSPQTITNTIAVGTTTPLSNSGLDIEQNGLGNAILVANQLGSGDIFTASKSGSTKFVINSSGYVGIGTNVPTLPLTVNATAPDIAVGDIIDVSGNLTSTANTQYGIRSTPFVVPGSASTQNYYGILGGVKSSSTNVNGASLQGVQANPFYNGTSTLGTAIGGYFKETAANNSSTISNAFGIVVQGAAQSGCTTCTFISNAGMQIYTQSLGTNNSNLIIGGTSNSISSGNFSIYNSSTYNNYFAGSLGIGTSAIGNGEVVVNQPNSAGDIFSASQSGSTKFRITNAGNVVHGSSALATNATDGFLYLDTSVGAPSGTPTSYIGTVPMEYDTTNNKLMVYNSGWKTTTAFADYAEWADAPGAASGDIVTITNQKNPSPDETDPFVLAKSSKAYDQNIAGVVSQYAEDANAANGYKKSPDYHAIALVGRVPVKVSSTNGTIQAGDYLTSSSLPGVAQKATKPGEMIGKALESYTDTNTTDIGHIMVLVNVSYADPTITITDSGNLAVSGQPLDTTPLALPTTPQANTGNSLATQAATSFSPDQYQQLNASVTSLQQQYASLSAQMVNPQTISSLTSRVASLEKLFPTMTSLPLTPLSSQDATISGTLSVSGRTVLSDVGITGTLNMGLLSINGLDTDQTGSTSATINTLSGPLKFQSMALAGIDMFNGKVTIDTSGNIQSQGTVTAKKYNVDTSDSTSVSVGEATIPVGQTSVVVKTTAVSDKSNIFVTVKAGLPVPLSVVSQNAGTSFTVEVTQPQSQGVKFSWWIVN